MGYYGHGAQVPLLQASCTITKMRNGYGMWAHGHRMSWHGILRVGWLSDILLRSGFCTGTSGTYGARNVFTCFLLTCIH